MMTKIKLDVAGLKVGMYVTDLDRPWLESPFLFQGFKLRDADEIDTIRSVCEYVYVDPERSDVEIPLGHASFKVTAPDNDKKKTRRAAPVPYTASFEEEIRAAREVHDESRAYVNHLFDDVRAGKAVNVSGARAVVRAMVDSILRNPDALALLSNLKDKNEHSVAHSINVCILCLAFGRFLGMPKELLHELGMGALLHDIGEMRVPEEILENPGLLSKEDNQVLQTHTDHGQTILSGTKGIPPSAIEIAQNHHERLNGKGYPRGIVGDDIGYLTKIVAIVDVYDSVTTPHTSKPSLSTTDALKNMYDWRNSLFDSDLVEQFIQCLGIYPIGSVVELNTGEVGIVISISVEQRLLPKLMLVRTAEKKPYLPPRIINLAQYAPVGDGLKYEVRKVVSADAYGIDLKGYLLRELPLGSMSIN